MLELERLWSGVRVVVGTILEAAGTALACVGMALIWAGQSLWFGAMYGSEQP